MKSLYTYICESKDITSREQGVEELKKFFPVIRGFFNEANDILEDNIFRTSRTFNASYSARESMIYTHNYVNIQSDVFFPETAIVKIDRFGYRLVIEQDQLKGKFNQIAKQFDKYVKQYGYKFDKTNSILSVKFGSVRCSLEIRGFANNEAYVIVKGDTLEELKSEQTNIAQFLADIYDMMWEVYGNVNEPQTKEGAKKWIEAGKPCVYAKGFIYKGAKMKPITKEEALKYLPKFAFNSKTAELSYTDYEGKRVLFFNAFSTLDME